MQNFYELENLIEKKKLDEIKYMQHPEGDPSQYAGKIPEDPNVAKADQAQGRRTKGIKDPGRAFDRQVQQANWDAAVAADPKKAIFTTARDELGVEKRAAAAADAKIGLQHVVRKGTGVKDVVRTFQNNMRMKLSDPNSPHSRDPAAPNALKLQAALFQKQYFGRTFELPDLFKMIMSRTKMDITDIKPALKLLRQVAGNQIRVFKGIPFPKIQIVDPFTLGGAGSAPETPDVDAENIHTAAGGASLPDPGTAGDQYGSRSASTIAGGPQNLAPQVNSKWQEVEGRANQAIMKHNAGELPDPEEIESIINTLKSVASEYPEKDREIKGYLKNLEKMIPQREWLEIYESMCVNGI